MPVIDIGEAPGAITRFVLLFLRPLIFGLTKVQKAALTGTLHMPLSYDELSGLSPVVRHEVLTGELMRRLRSFPEVKEEEIDVVVRQLLSQPLDTTCSGLQNSGVLLEQIRAAKDVLGLSEPSPIPTPAVQANPYGSEVSLGSQSNSTLLDSNTLAATASAPEHPSTPVSFTPSINTPPRTASPTGSIAPGTEKERLLMAVTNLDPARYKNVPTKAADVTEMLLSLSKKERAMCLFSAEYLRTKVESARSILDALAEEEEPASSGQTQATAAAAALASQMSNMSVNTPTTPQPQHRPAGAPASGPRDTPQTPELSFAGASATTSPVYPQTPAGASSVHTLATLAKLPAVEIVKLASSPQSTGLPLPKADPNVIKSTDDFVNGLLDKSAAVQKQLLGEKL